MISCFFFNFFFFCVGGGSRLLALRSLLRPPHGIALIEEDLLSSHTGRENPQTPLPPLHKGHTISCES
jgi:hypothetical protein